MERVLNLNTNQTKQAIYRGLTPLVSKEESKFIEENKMMIVICVLFIEGTTYAGLVLDKLFGK
jgi:hypothetical protein